MLVVGLREPLGRFRVTPFTDREDWFGINSPGGGATPDAAAFASGLRQATAPGPQVRLCSGG